MAKDLGFDGIELRGLGSDIFTVKAKPFTPEQLPGTKAKLASLGLTIPCVTSGCCVKYAPRAQDNYDKLIQYIDLAHKLGSPYVRVLADLAPRAGRRS
jgi:fatty-acyl-CoA synthase